MQTHAALALPLLALAIVACDPAPPTVDVVESGARPTPTPEATAKPTAGPTPTPFPVPLPVEPCVQTTDICDERDVSGFDPFGGAAAGSGGAAYGYEPQDAPTVEEVLEKGLYQSGASPVHIAFRGAPIGDSVRCDWRGVARAAQQREESARFWFGLDEDLPLPPAAEIENTLARVVGTLSPAFQASQRARWATLARGGFSTDTVSLACYADYQVQEYLLGSGPVV